MEPEQASGPQAGEWAEIDFLNFSYSQDFDDDDVFSTVDGEFVRGEFGDPDFLSFSVVEVVYGDIGGGDTDEAMVSVAYNTGGTGQFSNVFVYEVVAGEPILLDRAGVGDRALGGIVEVEMEADELVIGRYDGEAACCPDRRVDVRYRLESGRLVAVSDPAETATIFVSSSDSVAPEIKFLVGTTSAFIVGDVSDDSFAILEAGRGQLLTLTMEELEGVTAVQGVELVDDNDEVLLTVGPGSSESVTLPYDGFYSLQGVSGGGAGPQVELELSIR